MGQTAGTPPQNDRAEKQTEAEIENYTGLPSFWFEQMGPQGERLEILIVRGTFDFAHGGAAVTLAQHQSEIVYGDKYEGVVGSDVMGAVVVADGDLVPYKPGTDILVYGDAHAPYGQITTNWIAGIRVGKWEKFIRLHGPRTFKRNIVGWSLTPTEPILNINMDFRLAYGGCIVVPADFTSDGREDWIKLPSNPAGRGWLPDVNSYAHLPTQGRKFVRQKVQEQVEVMAPQVEDALDPVRSPFSNLPSQGLGPIARWWQPRSSYQGKYSEFIHQLERPCLPKNFDPRFFQSASAIMVATPHLAGDEQISFAGLLPSKGNMRLPGWRIVAVTTHASGSTNLTFLLLDTLRLHLDTAEVSLVWRAHFAYDDPVVNVVIGATKHPIVDTAVIKHTGGEVL